MSLEIIVAAAMFVGVIAYALFGGADFGAGWFDLTAGGTKRGARVRTLIDHSIGPVWEANHVWLIYVLVIWWTAFPTAFAAAMNTLLIPLFLALLGIVLRGAAFAFRKFAPSLRAARLFGAIFAVSSAVTPFFLGAVAGGIASGRVPLEARGDLIGSWVNPTSMVGGLVAVATCAFLAGVFLTADAERTAPDLVESMRTRALVVGVLAGLIVVGGLVPLRHDAPTLWDGLTSAWVLPVVIASAVAGALTLWALFVRRYRTARVSAIAAVTTVLTGWGLGQYPWLLVDEITISDAAGADATLVGLLVVVAIAVVLVLPSMAYLYVVTQRQDAH